MGIWGWFVGVSDGWHTCGTCHGSGEVGDYGGNIWNGEGATSKRCSSCKGEGKLYFRNGISYPKPDSPRREPEPPPWVK